AMAVPLAPAVAQSTPTGPRVRLTATKSDLVARRHRGKAARLNVGVFVSALDQPLELRVRRPSYDDPLQIDQVVETAEGAEIRPLPPEVLNGWNGLADFLKIDVADSSGTIIRSSLRNFCPNAYERQRVGDQGPVNSLFPYGCYANPFTRGYVWGIDRSWAVSPFGYRGPRMRVPDGDYRVTMTITDAYSQLFDIASDDATVAMNVTVKTVKDRHCESCNHARRQALTKERNGSAATNVPDIENPDPAILPDLQSLPSFGIRVNNGKRRSYLTFGANVWVGGASSLVVEGFRRSDEDVMDAYQYFYQDGEPIGRSQVGTFEFDTRRGHTHWHFRQFARYSLLNAASSEIVRSKKEAFCLAPTDPIDLLLQGAEWNPYLADLSTICGSPNSIWIRETLPLGWGDTYYQGLPGQSFDITNLPNATYYISVEANPGALLHEQNLDNNIELRAVILRGKPGARRVTVPPWHGIDTD
ncbi:MAG: hypothetical protein H0U16_07130, partial [Actinobacteria bacterium]|nr:hypothetical protein [Actinomycetota bacterium]